MADYIPRWYSKYNDQDQCVTTMPHQHLLISKGCYEEYQMCNIIPLVIIVKALANDTVSVLSLAYFKPNLTFTFPYFVCNLLQNNK